MGYTQALDKKSVVQALDEKSVLFLSTKAWDILCKKFKCFERPHLHKLVSELTSPMKNLNESVVDYLTIADDMNYKMTLLNEGVSEKMFISITMKGLTKEYKSFTTLVTFNKKEKVS